MDLHILFGFQASTYGPLLADNSLISIQYLNNKKPLIRTLEFRVLLALTDRRVPRRLAGFWSGLSPSTVVSRNSMEDSSSVFIGMLSCNGQTHWLDVAPTRTMRRLHKVRLNISSIAVCRKKCTFKQHKRNVQRFSLVNRRLFYRILRHCFIYHVLILITYRLIKPNIDNNVLLS